MWWTRKKTKRSFNKQWVQTVAENVVNERWIWDAEKNAANKQKHGLSFEVAILVFNDNQLRSRPDQYPHEERWQTIGLINGALVLVVHTVPQLNARTGKEMGRIITARKATAHERRAYEEGTF